MITIMRKILLLLFAVWLTALSASAYDFVYNNIYYNITSTTSKTVEVTYKNTSYNSYRGNVSIPSSVSYNGTTYTVKAIGECAFRFCSSLKRVTIPSNVTTISEYGFFHCDSLTSISIPNAVTSIGKYAFACTGLTSITLPSSLTAISERLFWGCLDLTSVTIGNSVTTINQYAFDECSSLASITIPNSVITIGDRVFYECHGLTSVTIGNSVTSIGDFAFYDCDALSSVTIPNSVTTIGISAFCSCNGLTSVTIGSGVTSIGSNAFNGSPDLRSVTCLAITPPTMPSSTFQSSTYMNATLTVPRNCRTAYQADAIWGLFSTIKESFYSFDYNGIYYNVTSSNSVAVARGKAANNYSGSLTIPSTVPYGGTTYRVTSVADSTFYNCINMTAVSLPNSIDSIGSYAFYNCSKLANITLPNSVTKVGNYAFGKCSVLVSVVLSNSMTEIPRNMFRECTKLSSVTNFASVKSIGNSAFYNCNSLSDFTLPSGLTTIEGYAFYKCTSLTSVNLPNTLTSIGGHAFANCTGLTSVTIPRSMTSIDKGVFIECYGLTSVTIPNTVTSIGQSAFSRDSSLVNITIPSSVTSIGSQAFYGCKRITSITIPEGVTEIGMYTFTGCSSLSRVTLPSTLISIANTVFSSCVSLKSITIPASVTSIGGHAFANCTGLTSVTCLAVTPPAMTGDEEFSNSTYSTAALMVPTESVTNYQTATGWKNFTNIRGIPTYDEVLNVDGGTLHFTSEGTYPWIFALNEYGDFQVQSGNSGILSSSSSLKTTVTVDSPSMLIFNYKARCNADHRCRIYIDGTYSGTYYNGNEDVWKLGYVEIPVGTHTIEWRYLKNSASTQPEGDFFALDAVKLMTNFTVLDYALNVNFSKPIHFTTGGDYPWSVTYGGVLYDEPGSDLCALSSNRGIANSSSVLTATVNVPRGGTLSFYYVARGEGGLTPLDKCLFEIDGVQQFCYGARENYWFDYEVDLTPGTHTLTWSYIKNGSNDPEGDYFCLDYVYIDEPEITTGDVNGDGSLSIADVSVLIDLLLSGGEVSDVADFNGDGSVTIADVSALIDFLLTAH